MKPDPTSRKNFWLTWPGIYTGCILAGILFYLLTRHTAHTFGVLPYLLLLTCPIMHLFMHHGHGKDHK